MQPKPNEVIPMREPVFRESIFRRLFTRDAEEYSRGWRDGNASAMAARQVNGTVLIRVTKELLEQLFTRTHDGLAMSLTMGEPQEDGTYAPTVHATDDGKVVVDRFVLDEWRTLKAAASKKPGKGGLVAVQGGKIEPLQ